MEKTIGELIDLLSITNLRIWKAEDIKRKTDATDKEIADACRITNVANKQRNDLIEAIDKELNEIADGKKQIIYRQGRNKIYG